jgi:hypothetical protein
MNTMDDQEHIHMLHIASIDIADLYHQSRNSNNVGNEDQLDNLMKAAIHIRRAIPKDDDGTRYGHAQYYKAMTLGEF